MIKNFFNVAGADAVKRIAEWIRHKFYTKTEIDDMLSAGMKYKVVNELPATGEAGTFYLVPKQSAGTGDVYDEYIYVDGSYEHIGSTEIDLSNYYTKTQTDNLLGDKVDKESGKGLSTNDYTTAEKNKLSNIEAGAEVNVQSDWNQSDSTKDDFIKNKPTLRQPSADGTAGQYLKSNGSGNAPSWETMDSAPTANSTKAVTSGGVKTALDGKQASVTITTKTDDAGDNDKVIMQASGVTDTTTFVRRSLTNIRDWLLKKLIPEELLKWGGLNGQGERTALGVIDSTLINNIRANRVAWLTADHFAVEYSRDGGTTWQNSRHIDDIMNWTSSPNGTNIYIGDADAEHIATSAYMTRITLTTAPSPASSNNYTFYCKIVKMCFYVATMGSTGCKLNVYLRTQANVESNTDTWVHVAEDCTLTGWSGWNIINFPSGIMTYGNNKSAQYGQIRMVFSADGYSGNGTTNYGLSLQRLRVYAPDCWGVGNSLANYDSPFAIYADKHAVFPSTVTATKLIKSGGTDSQLLVADGSVISMPIAITKGGTGATTAFKAEYNINTNVRNNHLTGDISDSSRLAFCSTAPSTTNGVFAGYRTMSQVWTWIKTHFDSSPTSGSGNGITSGGVYSALEEKVNLQPDFTVSQIDYSAGNVGKWQKVLRFPDGADLVINMKKTAMGSDATSTLWFSSSSMGDSYTSLFGNHSVRFVHDGGYVFLVLACRKSTNEPIESYTFQIAHSSVPMSDIVAVTDASPITATPKEPSIVYRAPITTGAVSFNVNSSGAGSVYMSGHNDFLGNMTSEASNGVTVTMSGATEGQIYRFVFTRNITGGVTFKQSNVAYCTISGDVNAGDTITLTAVSNTADGWLYEQESAGIKSTDGSVNVEYDGGVADLSINIPPDVVRNNEWTSSGGHRVIAIGDGASADTVSNNVAIGKEADASGNSAVCVGGNSEASGNYSSSFGYNAEASAFGAVAIGGNAVANGSGAVAIGGNQQSQATISAGYSVAIGGRAIAPSNSVAIGHNANGGTGSYGTTIGKDAESSGSNTCAVGYGAKAQNTNAIAVGSFANANQMKGEYGKHELVQFKVNDESKKVYTSSTAETISIEITGIGTFAGIDIPANNMLFVLSEELEFANELLFEVDGIMKQKQSFSSSALNYILSGSKIALGSSGLYAYKFSCGNIDYSDINSSANAYFFATSGNSYDRINGISIGRRGVSIGSESIAIGVGATSIRDGQIVLGQFNAESGTDLFQIGNGTESNRKNILTIDSSERLKVCSYVGETQIIDMSQQTGSLSNITKAVYRIRWDDTGTINLTLGTGGCVEGQRVTIFAETNDVSVSGKIIVTGRYMDFVFIAGDWRAPQDPWQ